MATKSLSQHFLRPETTPYNFELSSTQSGGMYPRTTSKDEHKKSLTWIRNLHFFIILATSPRGKWDNVGSYLACPHHIYVYKIYLLVPRGLYSRGRTSLRFREVSKPQDSGLDFSNRSEICQAPWQQHFRAACQISERYDGYNIQSRGFETSLDHTVKRRLA